MLRGLFTEWIMKSTSNAVDDEFLLILMPLECEKRIRQNDASLATYPVLVRSRMCYVAFVSSGCVKKPHPISTTYLGQALEPIYCRPIL